jgi:hypothetical protein
MARPKNSRANEVLVAALACGATQESAARQAGVSLSTVHRRLADPDFCRALQAFRADIVQRTAAALTAAGLEFVKTLVGLTSPGTPPATRLGAARAGLELGMKVREVADFEQRLAALEEQMQAQEAAG